MASRRRSRFQRTYTVYARTAIMKCGCQESVALFVLSIRISLSVDSSTTSFVFTFATTYEHTHTHTQFMICINGTNIRNIVSLLQFYSLPNFINSQRAELLSPMPAKSSENIRVVFKSVFFSWCGAYLNTHFSLFANDSL